MSDFFQLISNQYIDNFLKNVVVVFLNRAIWNDLKDTEASSSEQNIIVTFTDDKAWEEWGAWVFRRCEVSSNEKLVRVLHKVCNISVNSLEAKWAKTFYEKLLQLVKHRIACCTEDDMQKKLKKFESILNQ